MCNRQWSCQHTLLPAPAWLLQCCTYHPPSSPPACRVQRQVTTVGVQQTMVLSTCCAVLHLLHATTLLLLTPYFNAMRYETLQISTLTDIDTINAAPTSKLTCLLRRVSSSNWTHNISVGHSLLLTVCQCCSDCPRGGGVTHDSTSSNAVVVYLLPPLHHSYSMQWLTAAVLFLETCLLGLTQPRGQLWLHHWRPFSCVSQGQYIYILHTTAQTTQQASSRQITIEYASQL